MAYFTGAADSYPDPAGGALEQGESAPGTLCQTGTRSEEHTSELQSHHDLVCRLLLEKKNKDRKSL